MSAPSERVGRRAHSQPRQETRTAKPKDGGGLFDFRPVFRNSSAMAYAMAYCVHTLEMSALRGGHSAVSSIAASTK